MPIFLSGYRAYSLPLYISPCLSLGPCVALLYPSVRLSICPCMRLSVRVCPSGGGKGVGGPRHVRRVQGPSLSALLVVLSQSLCIAAHLCEALRVVPRAHPTFLGWLDLCQNVPDLSLSQLEYRGKIRMVCKRIAALGNISS